MMSGLWALLCARVEVWVDFLADRFPGTKKLISTLGRGYWDIHEMNNNMGENWKRRAEGEGEDTMFCTGGNNIRGMLLARLKPTILL